MIKINFSKMMNMTKNKIYSLVLISGLLILPNIGWAQQTGANTNSFFSNALFNIMLAVIALLLILIAIIGNVLKNISKSDYLKAKMNKRRAENSNTSKITGIAILLMLSSYGAFAQNAGTVAQKFDWTIGGLSMTTFFVLLFIIVCEIAVMAVLLNIIKGMLRSDIEARAELSTKPVAQKNIIDVLNASVDIENEKDILLDHDYDGIKELDNNLPPWWKYGFYVTILIAFVYMIHYHIAKTGDLQGEEYNKSVAIAKAEIAEYMKNSTNNVDESNVKMLENPADITTGKEVYTANCSACHGKAGEGTVGPNLTDKYWLHGGSIVDVFKSIKYGWLDKGMKSWKEDLSPMQIAQVTSYILSLQGTNPPNAKAAQGELYSEGGAVASDSTSVKTDSLSIAPVDSLKK